MKKFLFFLLLAILASGSGICQTTQKAPNMLVDPESKLITYKEVVNQEGIKDVLYDRGASWISWFYKSPASVLKVLDKVNGKIEGTARVMTSYIDDKGSRRDGALILYDIKLEFKDNKYRYIITNFSLKGASRVPLEKWLNKNDPAYNPQWDLYLFQVDTTMQSLIRNMKEGMKPKVIKKDEW